MANNNIPEDEQEFMNGAAGPIEDVFKQNIDLVTGYQSGYSEGFSYGVKCTTEYYQKKLLKTNIITLLEVIVLVFLLVSAMRQ